MLVCFCCAAVVLCCLVSVCLRFFCFVFGVLCFFCVSCVFFVNVFFAPFCFRLAFGLLPLPCLALSRFLFLFVSSRLSICLVCLAVYIYLLLLRLDWLYSTDLSDLKIRMYLSLRNVCSTRLSINDAFPPSSRLTSPLCSFPLHLQVTRKLCKELNERFLCPMESDALEITLTGSQVSSG